MSSRFFSTNIDTEQGRALLEEGEAHHLLHVMRMKEGAEVSLFDGNGNAWSATVTGAGRREVELRLDEQTASASEGLREVVLAVAPPKGDRFRWLVEKVTELGVDRLVPLQTERSVVDPGAGKIDKLRQTMISACKQCGRNRFLTIDQPQPWSECVENFANTHYLLPAHPGGQRLRDVFIEIVPTRSLLFAIGPEGGFTSDEIELALEKGATSISLGNSILRTETAAITCAAAVAVS